MEGSGSMEVQDGLGMGTGVAVSDAFLKKKKIEKQRVDGLGHWTGTPPSRLARLHHLGRDRGWLGGTRLATIPAINCRAQGCNIIQARLIWLCS